MSMSRRTHNVQRRRSPRISALDATCKGNQQQRFGEDQQKTRSRSRIKRNFDDSEFAPVSKLAKQVWKGRDNPKDAHHSTDCVEWRSVRESESQMIVQEKQKHDDHDRDGKISVMPAKHTLELVLDTLQRRDTYEIFAEPVDPNEVEDYYEIIKEPMDFGTMRAKLHEGMYKTLEQFEHDVFLIPENAMHFNSSVTTYFRQARALHELAMKVFHALKTDPENFVSEFSGTRRRSMRKALIDPKDSAFKSGNVVSCKGTMRSPSTSAFQRASRNRSLRGNREGSLRKCEVADKRPAYQASMSSLNDHQGHKTLVLVNDGDIRYKDSLMAYVKDLGPTAKMVAKRKLLGQQESINGWLNGSDHDKDSQISPRKSDGLGANALIFRTFRDFTPAGSNPFNIRNVINSKGEKEKIGIPPRPPPAAAVRVVNKFGKKEMRNNHVGKSDDSNMPAAVRVVDKIGKKNNHVGKSDDYNMRPVILALESSPHTNIAADHFKSRNKKSCIVKGGGDQQHRPSPAIISHFTFDLPFLQARLNQMNVASSSSPSFEKEAAFSLQPPVQPTTINRF